MRKKFVLVLMYAILLLGGDAAFAQKTSKPTRDSVNKKSDSVNAAILEAYNDKITEIEGQRVADSIKKAGLEEQINALKTTDNLKKEELQQELKELREKDAVGIAQKKNQIDSLRATAKAYPVHGFFNDTLFMIYSKLGSFSAKERADAVTERIHKLKNKFRVQADSLKIVKAETTTDIVLGETIIMSVSENDALWNDTNKDALVQQYLNTIDGAIIKYKSETSVILLAKEIGLAVLVLLLIWILIVYIRKLFRWTAKKIVAQEGKLIRGIKIKTYTLFDEKSQVKALLNVNNVLKWFLMLLIVYISLPILFGIFPWTKNLADVLFGYILSPVKKIGFSLWHFLPNLITIVIIVIVFRYILRGIHFLKSEIEIGDLQVPGFYPDWAAPTYQIVRILVVAFMVVVIFPYLPGSNSPVFQGVSVFLGFLFTFGSAGSLSNIIAGLILTYMRLFTVGDRVKIGEVVGDVIEKTLLVTRVRTIKNEIISIPNATVMNSHTINYSSDAPDKGLIIHTTVTIGYDVPWRDMHDALTIAADKTEDVLKDPKPFVLQTSLDDFYVSYEINAYTRESNKQATIYSLLHQNIQDVCNEKGIEIMSAHYRAARDGNMTTIPADYLPKDYKIPGFNVKVEKDEKDDK